MNTPFHCNRFDSIDQNTYPPGNMCKGQTVNETQQGWQSSKPGDLARRWPAYQGCWIALIGDQVAGVGRTREAAQLAARHSRPRERISDIVYIPPAPGPDSS